MRTAPPGKPLFNIRDFIAKGTTTITPGTDMKASVSVPYAKIKAAFNSDALIGAVIRVKRSDDGLQDEKYEYGQAQAYELTIAKLENDAGENPVVRTDHQLIGSGTRLLHLKEIFGKEEDGDCLVCLTEPKDTILLPCRHMCMCRDCLLKMVTAKCPICRTMIQTHISFHAGALKKLERKS
mmetsp:Transcript_35169/g.56773  ORF Transcript_35169/g.56773 Transcript_35169/m.56773 type:complete len:181 (-) Transcript_35169:116-658(-)